MPTPADHPPRAPWLTPFPVKLLSSIATVHGHRDYDAAKSGDSAAALRLVRDLVEPQALHPLADWVAQTNPILASAHAIERHGVNAIPEALCGLLAAEFGCRHESLLVQANVVGHTRADGFARLARQPLFAGPVVAGGAYLLVDDFIGMGGTLANLRGYVLSKGAGCVGAIVLTGQPRSATLALSVASLATLRGTHGPDLEHWWQQRFGHAFDCLAESEARYLSRTPDADRVRDRIVAAQQAGNCG